MYVDTIVTVAQATARQNLACNTNYVAYKVYQVKLLQDAPALPECFELHTPFPHTLCHVPAAIHSAVQSSVYQHVFLACMFNTECTSFMLPLPFVPFA